MRNPVLYIKSGWQSSMMQSKSTPTTVPRKGERLHDDIPMQSINPDLAFYLQLHQQQHFLKAETMHEVTTRIKSTSRKTP